MKRLLIVDNLHPVFMELVGAAGYRCDYRPEITYNECLHVIGDYEGLLVRSKFYAGRELLDAAGKLEFIGRAGAGMDGIDVALAGERNIALLNAPEGNRDAVGEHALGMLLSLLNNLCTGNAGIRGGTWDREGNRGIELNGKTVGIVGYGYMGQCFAKKLSGLDVRVIAYDKYKSGFSDPFAEEVSMERLFAETDILSLHIPLTSETRQMVNRDYWNSFAKSIFFINTARGEVVDTAALLEAIASGKVRGAGLDVLEAERFPALQEQPWFKDLVNCGKILLSPHVAGWSHESFRRISEVLAAKVLALSAPRP
ncbi:D-3-phosphoglycerate dehydrogenase [Anseongella ginsenosidimutans]|uniref:D-3-phosphoglycerate dehydrogenase n=1 Tax=Anseongella ginsenosidimutans TaxID=496056 RepID=A0A4R3KR37_9SPHI|nr:NAD(P)-dependent oxidoreductase [Anseongella ginsenosidimutans]QEC52183.1 phosphoglycerate dehydrogenase [Anseongella ginsenosidimutans]TCS86725.1 D-3-phosphoglycerate dehydrogenase [Anseongella ginsenosidimutans]